MTAAKNTIGMKSVPLVPGSRPDRSAMSPEYIEARSILRGIFEELRQRNDLPSTDPEIVALLERRDTTRTSMLSIRRRDKLQSFKKYANDANSLPAHVLMKRISASRRRKAAAGASLSCTSVALSSYVRHFVAQFENPNAPNMPALDLPLIAEDQR